MEILFKFAYSLVGITRPGSKGMISARHLGHPIVELSRKGI